MSNSESSGGDRVRDTHIARNSSGKDRDLETLLARASAIQGVQLLRAVRWTKEDRGESKDLHLVRPVANQAAEES